MYHRNDTINIARNYLAGVLVENKKVLKITVPLSKPIDANLDTVTSISFTVLDLYQTTLYELRSNITSSAGYVRKNGIDIQINISNPPSGLADGACTVEMRGTITI
jgi:hypothetical protein